MNNHIPRPLNEAELADLRKLSMERHGLGAYQYTMDGVVTYIDRVTLKLFDLEDTYPAPSLAIGKHLTDLIIYTTAEGSTREKVKEGGHFYGSTYHYKTLKGDDRWASQDAYKVNHPETGQELVQIVLKDITEIKKAEKRLRESEDKYRSLFENIYDIYYRTDAEGRITLISPSVEGALGYSPDEIIGCYLKDFYVYPEEREKLLSLLTNNGYVENFEAQLKKKDLSEVWISTNAKLLRDSDNNVSGVEGIARDITSKKKIEEQVRQTQKMESIGTLAGGIAHEFNNILSIIIGNNELIMEDMPEQSANKESCEEIRLAGLRAKDIVKQLLTFSRQDHSIKRPIDICLVIQESLKLLQALIPKNIEIMVSVPSESLSILGDPTQINQILINLCNNATDALPGSGGEIYINVSTTSLANKNILTTSNIEPVKYVQIQVKDNGTGINKENLSRIFEPYFTTKEIGDGTGIGLAVVHGIVESHGGTISCESSTAEGTTFTILIPTFEGSILQDPGQETMFSGEGECILYVDDEPSLAKLGKRHLETLGYNVISITDPLKALDLIKTEPNKFDLVISDMAMPKMPGDELITEILAVNPKLPVIICTGYSSRISQEKAMEIGAKAFVMKPLNKSELAKIVRQVIEIENQGY